MQILNRLYDWYGKRVVLTVLGTIVVLVIVGFAFQFTKKAAPLEEANTTPSVTVRSVRDLGNGSFFDVVGTVTAVNEARLQTEAGGRVTRVSVDLGDTVGARTIIASIENASQYAALLQAEGAYESALASTRTSEVGRATAEENVVHLYRDSFTTVDSIVRTTIDQLFSNPRGEHPGLRINGSGQAPKLSSERVATETMLETWAKNINGDIENDSKERLLTETENNLASVRGLLATLSFLLANEKPNSDLTESELSALRTSFTAARASIDGAFASISSTRREYEQAQIASGENVATEAHAREKSALGALKQAQAAYEKTIMRSPIAGTVNALYLKEGTYVSPGEQAAVIANNGSLEILTSISDEESGLIAVGDTVMIEGTTEGIVTAIAPAIDPLSGKVAVKISIGAGTEIGNGSTVRVSFIPEPENNDSDTILIPLSALKITPSGAIAFGVTEDNTLIAIPVTLGPVRGELVSITVGLTPDTKIVVDARGLKEGEVVEVQ